MVMSSIKGSLYGVSLGPGDPGLMTRHAWDCLQRDAVWTYPVRNNNSESYALGIAQRAELTLPDEHYPLIFPMTHDAEKLAGYWLRAGQKVCEILAGGRDVMFLVEGDASTYSTFGHLARTVKALDEDIKIHIIAGVPSYNAAAASQQAPLADVDDTVAIIPAGYGVKMIERMLKDFDTLVLLKVKPMLDEIINMCEQHDILHCCSFIEKAGAPEQRIVNDVASLRGEKVNYLSLMIVRNPHRVRGEITRGCRSKKTVTQKEVVNE